MLKRIVKKNRIPYPITGLIKHAQVARILCKNCVSPLQFYIVCRAAQEHLPLPTRRAIWLEIGAKGRPETLNTALTMLLKKKLIKRIGERRKAVFEPTREGYIFYLMLIAEMERPIRDDTVFDAPKKTKFLKPRNGGRGPKAGRAMKSVRFSTLANKFGLSIWERCELASLPQWQRLEFGEPKSEAPASSV